MKILLFPRNPNVDLEPFLSTRPQRSQLQRCAVIRVLGRMGGLGFDTFARSSAGFFAVPGLDFAARVRVPPA
ncbi:MAG TPA: hypothetical protein VFN67_06730 [Polyangiales bacterium]|nr:hypothetical protein [Polyangiales bacterium]